MPKEIDWDNPYESSKEVDKLGYHLGVSRDDFYEDDMGSQGNFDADGYAKAVERAYSNNYDVRRSLEAGRMAGETDLPNNIGNMEDAYNAFNFMKDTHHDKIGNEEDFDYDEMAGVTNYWVKTDRKNFTDEIHDSFADYVEENQDESADDVDQQTQDIAFSPELQSAYSRINDSEQAINNSSNLIYGRSSDKALEHSTDGVSDATPHSDGADQRNHAAQDFHKEYKVGLMQGLRDNPFGAAVTQAAGYYD